MKNLLNFVQSNSDWEEQLTKDPYNITIKRKDNFIMFNYSQIASDFYNPIVKECRGCIIEDGTFKPVCIPFYKFGNYGEGYVDQIDWNSARVQEKVDGSLIKVWNYNNQWRVSTNGMIDARDAELASDISEYRTFYDLFMEAVRKVNLDFNKLNKNNTYMFELVSPYNRVVVPYTEVAIRHIGTRNNITFQELNENVNIDKPKQYNFKSLDKCVNMAKELPFSEEGYVVVDANWYRVKIKSPAYVAAHHLKNNGVVTKERIVELIRLNEHEEFLNYYPEFIEVFNKIENGISLFIDNMENSIEEAKNNVFDTRKEFAEFAKSTKCPALMFNYFDGKVSEPKEWLLNQTNEKIVFWIGESNG